VYGHFLGLVGGWGSMLRTRLGLLTHETLANPLVAMCLSFSGGRLAGVKEPLRLPDLVSSVSPEAGFSSVSDLGIRDLTVVGLAPNFDERAFFAELTQAFTTLVQLPDLRQLSWGADQFTQQIACPNPQTPELLLLRDAMLATVTLQAESLPLDPYNSCLVEYNDIGYNENIGELTRQGVASSFISGYLGLAASPMQPAGMATAYFSQNLLGLPLSTLAGFFFFIGNYGGSRRSGTPGWLACEVGAQPLTTRLSGQTAGGVVLEHRRSVSAAPQPPRHTWLPQQPVTGGIRCHSALALRRLLCIVALLSNL
jgi:hypothetical protein